MIELGVALRNPATGQFANSAIIPSPAAMQSAYPRQGIDKLTATAKALPTVREVAAATGTTAQRKFPLGIGAAARTETENIGRTVAMFLRGKARP
jgi:hypothetical protein